MIFNTSQFSQNFVKNWKFEAKKKTKKKKN